METRQERAERADFERRVRTAYLEAVRVAHPADLVCCSCCGGAGEVPHEYSSVECSVCFGAGVEVEGPEDGLLTSEQYAEHVRDFSAYIRETPAVSDATCAFCCRPAAGICQPCHERLMCERTRGLMFRTGEEPS